MGYVLTRPVRYAERDDRGRTTKRLRFKRGDEPTGLPEDRVEAFKESGTLVDQETYDKLAARRGGFSRPVVTAAAQSGLTADPGLRDGGEHQVGAAGHLAGTQAEESGDVSDVEAPAGATGEGQEEDGGVEDVDDTYSDMTKDDLAAEAESRGLAKSGSKADLQARLREDDES
jgi:hypothetical protein